MPAERTLVALTRDQLREMALLLKNAGLPHEDLAEPGRRFYRLDDGYGPVGWAGLEPHGEDALLRSLIVPERQRGRGLGLALVAAMAAEARRLGARRLWLLTETAGALFAKAGFSPIARTAAPPTIAATREFRDLCPSTALCMVHDLDDLGDDPGRDTGRA